MCLSLSLSLALSLSLYIYIFIFIHIYLYNLLFIYTYTCECICIYNIINVHMCLNKTKTNICVCCFGLIASPSLAVKSPVALRNWWTGERGVWLRSITSFYAYACIYIYTYVNILPVHISILRTLVRHRRTSMFLFRSGCYGEVQGFWQLFAFGLLS